jgi:hypothetical protein
MHVWGCMHMCMNESTYQCDSKQMSLEWQSFVPTEVVKLCTGTARPSVRQSIQQSFRQSAPRSQISSNIAFSGADGSQISQTMRPLWVRRSRALWIWAHPALSLHNPSLSFTLPLSQPTFPDYLIAGSIAYLPVTSSVIWTAIGTGINNSISLSPLCLCACRN